jgi:hypothetical protein
LIKRPTDSVVSEPIEYVSLGTGLVTFALFSLSGFQLPHYMNIVFPFFAVITAQFLVSLTITNLRKWTVGQTSIGLAFSGIAIALLVLVKPAGLVGGLVWIVVITLVTFSIFRKNTLLSLSGRMVGAMLMLAGTLNLFLYPTLLRYQAGMATANYVNEEARLASRPTLLYEPGTGVGGGSFWTYEFYAQAPTSYVRIDSAMRAQVQKAPQQVFTTAEFASSLETHGFRVKRLAMFPYYHVSQLTYEFLNPTTRAKTLSPYVLAEVGVETDRTNE